MLYDYKGDPLKKYPTLYGDGTHDDTTALQALVDTYDSVILPAGLNIKITAPIEIDISKCKHFDGGNSTVTASGNISAFVISGSLTSSMSANPNTLTADIMDGEASFIFENCKIKNANSQQGTGVVLDGCFKANIVNCYIHNINIGIAIRNQCRDIKITSNHIYACWSYGIHFESTCNLHQCNIVDNIMNYATYCIYLDQPVQIANFQIVGNDIEVSNYPNVNDKTVFRCIKIVSGNNIDGQLSEIEIAGNTIQGHDGSDTIIDISGGNSRKVRLVSITGNHISNCKANMMELYNAADVSITGNTVANAGGYVFSLSGQNDNVAICGNVCSRVGSTNAGFVTAVDELRKANITGNNSVTTGEDPVSITATVFSDGMINGNVIAGTDTSIVVKPQQGTRNMLCNNICASGTYDTNSSVTAVNNI